MSYDVRVSGRIKITRYQDRVIPLSFIKEAEKYGFAIDPNLKLKGLSPAAIEKINESDLRYFADASATALQAHDEIGSAYYIEDYIIAAVNVIKDDGCVANGFFQIVGLEDGPDISRICINDNIITTEQAIITWPDGTKFKG
jgi:hypothetical protein